MKDLNTTGYWLKNLTVTIYYSRNRLARKEIGDESPERMMKSTGG